MQADFETERTPVSGSLQDDLLEVLSSLSFASAEEEETPEGVRIDVEEEDGTLSFYCGDDAMIGVRGPDEGSVRIAQDEEATETLRDLLQECNEAYFRSELTAAVSSRDEEAIVVTAAEDSGRSKPGRACGSRWMRMCKSISMKSCRKAQRSSSSMIRTAMTHRHSRSAKYW